MPAPVTITRTAYTDVDQLDAARFNASSAVSATVADAGSGSEGVIRLAGDLTGTAAAPQLAAVNGSSAVLGAEDFTFTQFSLDTKGRVTSATSRPWPASGVVAGTYGGWEQPFQLTVDAKGRVTSAQTVGYDDHFRRWIFELAHPIGTVIAYADDTDPNLAYLGALVPGVAWQRFAQGKVLVGADSADADFTPSGKTGGQKGVALTNAQIPSHAHTVAARTVTTTSAGAHTHAIKGNNGESVHGSTEPFAPWLRPDGKEGPSEGITNDAATETGGAHTHEIALPATTTGFSGSGGTHTNLQPYVVVNYWRRIS